MDRALEELGKWFMHYSLLLSGSLIIQPFIKGNVQRDIIFWGVASSVVFLITGVILVYIGRELERKRR